MTTKNIYEIIDKIIEITNPSVQENKKEWEITKENFKKVIEKNKYKNFFVYSDKDVDGLTSLAIFYRFLTKNKITFITHITKEYRIELKELVQKYIENYRVFVFLDIGVNSEEVTDFAKKFTDTTIIIIDHHVPNKTLEEFKKIGNIFVVNPHFIETDEKAKLTSTGGILARIIDIDEYETVLAMLSILADLQPSVGTNYKIIEKGLEYVQQLPEDNIIKKIAQAKNIKKGDLILNVIPLFNQLGKNLYGSKVYHILKQGIASDMEINEIYHIQTEIKNKSKKIYESIKTIECGNYIIVINDNITDTIVSGIANSLQNKYEKPILFLQLSNDKYYTGSARGKNILNTLKNIENILESYGGHQDACGFKIQKSNLNLLIEAIKKEKATHTPKSFDIELNLTMLEMYEKEFLEFYNKNEARDIEKIIFYSPDTAIYSYKKTSNGSYLVELPKETIIFTDNIKSKYNVYYNIFNANNDLQCKISKSL